MDVCMEDRWIHIKNERRHSKPSHNQKLDSEWMDMSGPCRNRVITVPTEDEISKRMDEWSWKIEENRSEWRRKGMGFPKDEMIFSYETCLTARSHSSDVKRTLVSQDWISRKTSILTSGFYQTRHLRASYGYLFFKMASSLDAFSSYPLPRGYSACLVRQLIN